ncbi:hypothetical protein [Aureibacter tunicatorum]|uniref:Uncharacterized protein n=1 Tax=Aureibacter tunicatorum TaxID=866807 RepID=A0AAE3XLW8_9BACT|nr:hypothetical protein [Aureibacter tunicatorum]MDR6238418.1 hypothetical protein [Aureibacter tunicatorum]BDD03450.1 hypothetical protein AUTU_09330 [Aureibacter tunicatorum]
MRSKETNLIDLFIEERKPLTAKEAVMLYKKVYRSTITQPAISKICNELEKYVFLDDVAEAYFLTSEMYTAIKVADSAKKGNSRYIDFASFGNCFKSDKDYQKHIPYIQRVLEAYNLSRVFVLDLDEEYTQEHEKMAEKAENLDKLMNVVANVKTKLEKAGEDGIKWSKAIFFKFGDFEGALELKDFLKSEGLEADLSQLEDESLALINLKFAEPEEEEIMEEPTVEQEPDQEDSEQVIEDSSVEEVVENEADSEPEIEVEPEEVFTEEQQYFMSFLDRIVQRLEDGEGSVVITEFVYQRQCKDFEEEFIEEQFTTRELKISTDGMEEGCLAILK